MSNLTRERNLVRYATGIDPVPDHYLVVLKRVGLGRQFRASLAPGERLKRSFLEPVNSFITYAVSCDKNLRHDFAHPYKTHDQLHSFELKLTIEYRVSDPRALVEKLESDPLRRIENEVDLLVQQRMKFLDWAAVERERIDLSELLFRHRDRESEEPSNLERLQAFATTQGIEVYRLAVHRILTTEEIRVAMTEKAERQKREILALQHGTAVLEQSQDQSLEARKREFHRRQEIAQSFAKSTLRTFEQLMLKVGSMDCEPQERGQILSLSLHLMAEALRGDDADPATVERYRKGIEARSPEIIPLLNLGAPDA